MPPKTSSKPKPQGGSTFKALDDFLEKSAANTGELNNAQLQEHKALQSKQLKEKYFDLVSPQSLQSNLQNLDKCRTQSLVFGGITAGIFGFDGLQGMMFYLFLVAFVSLMIAVRLGFQAKPYFTKLGQAVGTGLFGNTLTYMLMWVMFHNLVYVL